MNEETKAKEELRSVLRAGVVVQTISAIVTFALQYGKSDFLKKLNELLLDFQKNLPEDEKSKLKEMVKTAISERSAEFLLKLGTELNENELEQALKLLQTMDEEK